MDRRKILLVVAVVVAVLGAGLVFVYANNADERASDGQQMQYRLVATQVINVGESVADASNAGKLLSKQVPEAELLQGSTNDGDDFADSIALTTIYPGEQLLTQKFGTVEDIQRTTTVPIPEGQSAITLQMTDPGRVGSFTKPGAHVAIYFQPYVTDDPQGTSDGTDPNTQPTLPDNVVQVGGACVIEPDVLVVGVGSQSVDPGPVIADPGATAGPEQEDTVPVTLLTVAVNSEQASILKGIQFAASNENKELLSFALINDESDVRNVGSCVEFVKSFRVALGLRPVAAADDVTNG